MKIGYIFALLVISSLVLCSKNMRDLATIKVNKFEQYESTSEIQTVSYDFEGAGDAFFSYDISVLKGLSENNIVLSVHNPGNAQLEIKCILSTEAKMDDDFARTNNNICPALYDASDHKVTNIYLSFTKEQLGLGSLLMLKVTLKKSTNLHLDLFVRQKNAYKTKLEALTIKNPFAFTAIEFNVKDYINKQYLLTVSERRGMLIFGHKDNKFWEIDETYALPISDQSLSTYFMDFDKVIIFAGSLGYDKSKTSKDLSVKLSEIKGKKINYYTRINEDNYYGFSGFYSDCADKKVKNYLLVNFGALEDSDYYIKFNELVGANVRKADFPPGYEDVEDSDLKYSKFKRIEALTQANKKDADFHVFELECKEEGDKIIANLQYSKRNAKPSSSVTPGDNAVRDYNFAFEDNNEFKITYSLVKHQFALSIYTSDADGDVTFTVKFEGKNIEMNNKEKLIFTKTSDSYKELTIKAAKDVDALISFASSVKSPDDGTKQKFYTLNSYIINDQNYFYYEMEHEFDTNYYVDVEIENPTKDVLPFCYYLSTTAVIQNVGRNCILLPASKSLNFTFSKIFKRVGADGYNAEEPQYYLVMYNNHSEYDFQVKRIDVRTDLPKSTPINKSLEGRTFLYLEPDLEKNKPSYFNLDIMNMTEDYHFDLYILDDDTSAYTESQLDIKCIYAFEIGVDFVAPLFDKEENNVCGYVNKEDYTSNVSHVVFTGVRTDKNEKLIIKVTPKKNMKVRFLYGKFDFVYKNYAFDDLFGEATHLVDDPSIFKIFEINKTNLESLNAEFAMFYDRDKHGMEFYARKGKEFKKLYDRGSLTFVDIKGTLNKLKDFDKFIFVVGKNDCEKMYCLSRSKYQVKYLQKVFYFETDGLDDYYRIPISISNCAEGKNYYVVYRYKKPFKNNNVYLGKYELLGKVVLGHYIDTFVGEEMEKGKTLLKDYQHINDNDYHLDIIRFTCEKNFLAYFDYFRKEDSPSSFKIREGEVKFFIVPNSTNVTFDYESVSKVKIDLLGENRKYDPDITFEGNKKNIKSSVVNLFRKTDSINHFYIAAPKSEDLGIRVSGLVSLDKMKKEKANNVYSYNGFFVYDIPENSASISVIITRKGYRLRLLEEKGIKVCYNLADTIILMKNDGNCFTLNDKYEFKSDLPDDGKKYYLTLYPDDDSQLINVEKTSAVPRSGSGSGANGEDGEGGGSSWIIILIVVIIVLIIVVALVCIIIQIRKKRVSSTEIDTDIKQPSPLTN